MDNPETTISNTNHPAIKFIFIFIRIMYMNFMMEIVHNNYIRIILSSVAVYFFIILAIRLFGKKELAQLSVYDLVFILLISNAVQL